MDQGNLLISQITLGAASSYVLQVLKNAKWFPLLQKDSSKIVKIFFASVAAICSATGLRYIHDPAAHTLLIENFSLAMVAVALWHWAQQFVLQEGWYQLKYSKDDAPATIIPVAVPPSAHDLAVQQAKKKVEEAEHELEAVSK